jgi:hypothetical protein
MTRVDVFGVVHKGLRAALFEAVKVVARTDFSRAEEAERARAEVLAALAFLEEHGRHEDAIVLPELAVLAPALCADLQGEHGRLDGLHREVQRLCARLTGASPVERIALGRRLHDAAVRLLAESLGHMQREEAEATRVLHAHRSDDELRALHGRILASIAPPRVADWMELILAAASGPERVALVAGLRSHLPPDAFAAAVGPAQVRLGAADWVAVAGAAGV